MRKEILQEAAGYSVVHKRHRRWNKFVSALACIVVFCTTYALILPAITLEKSPQCEKTEHKHSDACYIQLLSQSKTVPVCTPESLDLHKHTEACQNESGELCCGYSDFVIHQHSGSCYGEDGNLWCTLPEIAAHTHDESCYAPPETGQEEAAEPTQQETAEPTQQEAPEPVLICGKEETILHQHTEACFETDESGSAHLICGKTQLLEHVHSPDCLQTVEEPVDTEALTCTLEEGEGAHTHSEEAGCYNSSGELICRLEESAGHRHGPLCYGAWELTCTFEEHTHTELCMPTETAPPLDLLATPEPPQQVLADGAEEPESAIITPHKTIDAFRDGADNPDTDLDNKNIDQTDLYRLYLDAQVSMVNKPIDLLIVVDQSGSMHNDYQGKTQDMTKENGAAAYRDEALRLVLNGTSSTNLADYEAHKQDGLIYQFLNANPENQVAVVGFQGHGYIYSGQYKYGSQYHYKQNSDGTLADVTSGYYQTNDSGGRKEMTVTSGIADTEGYLEAETLLPWTKEATFVDVQGIRYNATNYTAGYIQAQRELKRPAAQNNHQKVVLFLSDGIPTCYIAGQDGNHYREGDGSHDNTKGTDTATTTAFDNFIKANPDITLHTVSVKAGTAETRLTNMATQGHGQCFGVSTTDDLKKSLKMLMFGTTFSELKIEDTLSAYVDVHSQPDCKVIMKQQDGTKVTLYENNQITMEGQSILKSVTCVPGNKTVQVVFQPLFKPYSGATFTLSFNVKTNQTAYQKYAEKGYGGVKGDTGTDYGENKTSSEKDGFRSNDSAKLYYKDGDKQTTADYPHPVVQVTDRELIVKKQWLAYDGSDISYSPNKPVDFVLHQLATPVDPAVKTATVTVSSQRGSNYVLPTQVEIGSQVTLRFLKQDARFGSGSVTVRVNGTAVEVTKTGSNPYTYTYTFIALGNTDIRVSHTGIYNPYNFNLDVEPPTKAVWPVDTAYKTGTLSADGDWQMIFKNLPLSGSVADTYGNMIDVSYTYYVEELPVEDYTTTYDNNEGIVQGTITIKNRSTIPYTHELPNTGGAGTEMYTIGGLLIISIAVLLLYSKKIHGKEDTISS